MSAVIESDENARRIGSGLPGPGRPKGSENRINRDVRAMVLGALHEAGGQAYLVRQATENPKAFLALVARVIPKEVAIEVTRQYVVALPTVSPTAQAWIEHVHEARRTLEDPRGGSEAADGSGRESVDKCPRALPSQRPIDHGAPREDC